MKRIFWMSSSLTPYRIEKVCSPTFKKMNPLTHSTSTNYCLTITTHRSRWILAADKFCHHKSYHSKHFTEVFYFERQLMATKLQYNLPILSYWTHHCGSSAATSPFLTIHEKRWLLSELPSYIKPDIRKWQLIIIWKHCYPQQKTSQPQLIRCFNS